MVNENIKQKIQSKLTKQILCDSDVKSQLEALHKCFDVVTIDKAGNNFAFTCQKLYL